MRPIRNRARLETIIDTARPELAAVYEQSFVEHDTLVVNVLTVMKAPVSPNPPRVVSQERPGFFSHSAVANGRVFVTATWRLRFRTDARRSDRCDAKGLARIHASGGRLGFGGRDDGRSKTLVAIDPLMRKPQDLYEERAAVRAF